MHEAFFLWKPTSFLLIAELSPASSKALWKRQDAKLLVPEALYSPAHFHSGRKSCHGKVEQARTGNPHRSNSCNGVGLVQPGALQGTKASASFML